MGWTNPKEHRLATQSVMDHTDDAGLVFEANDAEALAKVEARFKALVGRGIYARPFG